MVLTNMLPDTGDLGTNGCRGPTDYVTNRIESGAEPVTELSTRVRDAASDRTSDVAERAVDELLERSLDRSLEFYEQDRVQTLLWTRTLGDTPMILGALAFTAGSIRHLYAVRQRSTDDG